MIIHSPKGDPRWAFLAVDELYEKVRSTKEFEAIDREVSALRNLIGELVEDAHEKFVRSTKPDVQIGDASEGQHLLVGEHQLTNGSIIRAASDVDRNTLQVWVEEQGFFSQEKQYSCVREFDDLSAAHDYMFSLTALLDPDSSPEKIQGSVISKKS